MRVLVGLLPLLGCGGGMVLCMWLMGRGHRTQPTTPSSTDEVAELRTEVARLRQELGTREREPLG